jgi:hypothetical protein
VDVKIYYDYGCNIKNAVPLLWPQLLVHASLQSNNAAMLNLANRELEYLTLKNIFPPLMFVDEFPAYVGVIKTFNAMIHRRPLPTERNRVRVMILKFEKFPQIRMKDRIGL